MSSNISCHVNSNNSSTHATILVIRRWQRKRIFFVFSWLRFQTCNSVDQSTWIATLSRLHHLSVFLVFSVATFVINISSYIHQVMDLTYIRIFLWCTIIKAYQNTNFISRLSFDFCDVVPSSIQLLHYSLFEIEKHKKITSLTFRPWPSLETFCCSSIWWISAGRSSTVCRPFSQVKSCRCHWHNFLSVQ